MSGLVACCSVSVRVDGMCLDQEKEGMEQTLTEKGGQCFPCLPKQPVFVVCCLFWAVPLQIGVFNIEERQVCWPWKYVELS